MKKIFSEAQIIGILKEQESGMKLSDLCRKHGFHDSSFYKWKAKFGGMSVSDAVRLKALEDEDKNLKRLVADLNLDLGAVVD